MSPEDIVEATRNLKKYLHRTDRIIVCVTQDEFDALREYLGWGQPKPGVEHYFINDVEVRIVLDKNF